jgi:hypothetical protein
MATVIRPEISTKNKYWISKHRHYELKHFCLQYPIWKQEYETFEESSIRSSAMDKMPIGNIPGDPTIVAVLKREYYKERIDLIEQVARETDEYLYNYILKAVTEGLSYTYLKSSLGIPCGKDMYYDRYRRFFWLLSRARK